MPDSPETISMLAVAKANGILYKQTQKVLKDDKHDGLRLSRLQDTHTKFTGEMIEMFESYGLVSSEDVVKAHKLAGDPET